MFLWIRDTYIEQNDYEKINDYNDRCIRKAIEWYTKHLPKAKFVLITDDVANRDLATKEKLIACSSKFYIYFYFCLNVLYKSNFLVKDYVTNIEGSEYLVDKLSRKDFHSAIDAEDLFPPHLSTYELHKGIKDGQFIQGTYRASRDNFLEGFVNTDKYKDSVSILI